MKAMSTENLVQFMQQVHPDYWAAPDRETQTLLAVQLGAHLGYEFTQQEVENYMHNQDNGKVENLVFR